MLTSLAPSRETTDMAIETSRACVFIIKRERRVNLINDLYGLREDKRDEEGQVIEKEKKKKKEGGR